MASFSRQFNDAAAGRLDRRLRPGRANLAETILEIERDDDAQERSRRNRNRQQDAQPQSEAVRQLLAKDQEHFATLAQQRVRSQPPANGAAPVVDVVAREGANVEIAGAIANVGGDGVAASVIDDNDDDNNNSNNNNNANAQRRRDVSYSR